MQRSNTVGGAPQVSLAGGTSEGHAPNMGAFRFNPHWPALHHALRHALRHARAGTASSSARAEHSIVVAAHSIVVAAHSHHTHIRM